MKKVEAVFRLEKLDAVRATIEELGCCPGMMVSRIDGHGRQKGVTQQFRGREYRMDLLPKMKVEIVVTDEHVDSVVKAISDAARTGEVGDGKIFVSPIEDVIRIRTGESGETAV
jgi:nitrogen regulatory protein P-II 1